MMNCCDTDSHRITRYEKIYESREAAEKLLTYNLRPYGELVSIRYYDDNEDIQLLLALYNGDGYTLIYPDDPSIVSIITDGEPEIALEEKVKNPKEGLLAVVNLSLIYQYLDGKWVGNNIIDCGFLKDL